MFGRVSPLEHVLAVLAEMDRRYTQRVDSLDSLTDAKFVTFRTLIDSQAEKVALALASADKAVTKAEVAADKRFELLNELRAGVATREQLEALEKQLGDLATRIDRSEGRGVGLHAGWVYLLGGLAAVGTIVSLFIAFAN